VKRRTLLDSFVIRVPSKIVPLELESNGTNVQPPAVLNLESGGSSPTIDTGVPGEVEKDDTGKHSSMYSVHCST
jgi:hypothetical protein